MPDINLIKRVITRAAISHFSNLCINIIKSWYIMPPPLKKRWERHPLTLHTLCPPGAP